PDPARAHRERQPAEQRIEERRLAAAVRADDREAVADMEVDVDRPEAERAALDHRALEPGDHVAAARAGHEPEAELPRLVRLLDDGEGAELALERLLHVLRLLLLAALPVAALLPVLHAPRLRLDPLLLLDVVAPAVVLPRAAALALRLVLAPAAG